MKNNYFIHNTSIIEKNVTVGAGTKVWHFSHILSGVSIGKNCKIGQNVVIGPDVTIGNNVKIQNNVSIYKGVLLEDDVFCGPSCVFTNVFNPRSSIPRMEEIRITVVKKGASIGANATIICGNTIGEYAFVGAGAVVTRVVAPYSLVYGNPATKRGWTCYCGTKLVMKKGIIKCESCKRKYSLKNSILRPL